MWIRFVAEYCSKVDYIFKIDDDVVVNIYDLVSLVKEKRLNPPVGSNSSRIIIGNVFKDFAVVRDRKSKW